VAVNPTLILENLQRGGEIMIDWDSSFKPKHVRQEIERETLAMMRQYGRNGHVDLRKIAYYIYYKSDNEVIHHVKGINFLTFNYGLIGEVRLATHRLRRKGHPIVAGLGKTGYRYADEKCKDLIKVWDDRFLRWRHRTSNIGTRQRLIDLALIKTIIPNLKGVKKKQMILIQRKYSK